MRVVIAFELRTRICIVMRFLKEKFTCSIYTFLRFVDEHYILVWDLVQGIVDVSVQYMR
jgi:hypothetical protein